ncbi:MAG: PKD domain-containing protein [Bacteroidota bacterium]
MKSRIPFYLLLIVFGFINLSASAQKWIDMMEDPSANFYDIQKEANAYFAVHGTGRGTHYKQFKRWESNMHYYIDEQGNKIEPRIIYERANQFQAENSNRSSRAANWTDLGPFDWTRTSSWSPGLGRIDYIGIDPNNSSIIYIASPEGGCWKTTNGGISWASLTDGLTFMKLGCVTVDPGNSNHVYIGTTGAGLLKSTTGGTSLSQINNGLPSTANIKKVLIDPTNSNIVLLATSSGVYRSVNAGGNWTRTSTIASNDIEFKPGNSSIVYSSGNDFYKSTNGGVTFVKITNGITTTGRSFICVTPANANYVYLAQARGQEFGAFYRSTDSGTGFTLMVTGDPASGTNFFGYDPDGMDTGGQASYDMAMCASPTTLDEVHIGGIITWKTMDGGSSWVATTMWTYPNSVGYTHCDIHALEYVGNTLFVGSDGGISISTDKGDNFSDISAGLGIRMFYRMGCSASDPAMLAVGAQDNGGSILKSSGWIDWIGADGMETFIHPTNTNIIYGSSQNGSLYKSTNGGNSYSGITEPEASGNWTTPFIMDPNSATTLYAGYIEIYKSLNSGGTWTAISNFGGTAKFDHIVVAPTNSSYIYASKGTSIYKTTDGGTNWISIATGLGGATINRITVHNSSPDKVAVATSGTKVYTSANGGANWTNVSGNLPVIGVRCIIYENGTNEGIYAGLASGVYYRDNTMSNWVAYNTGLPQVPINELEIQYSSNKLRAATYGRGVWETDVYSVVAQPPVANFTSNVQQSCDGVINFSDLSTNVPTSWLWEFGDGKTSTLQNPSHTYTVSGTYTVKLTSTNGVGNDVNTKTAFITVTVLADPITQNAGRCGPGIVNLTATGSNTLYWYTAASGGNLVNTGGSYSPNISTTTNFYVENSTMGALTNLGAMDTTFSTGMYYATPDVHGLYFDVLAPCVIRSVKVYAGTAGNRTFEVLNNLGTGVKTKTVFVPAGESRVTLDFNLPVGTQYFIKATGTVDLYRNAGGASYPYTISGLVSITETDVEATNPGYYYFFYDWQVQSAGCVSNRKIITGSMDVCTGIEDLSLTNDIMIYPNPNNGIALVVFSTPKKNEYTVEIKNTLGQIVYREVLQNHTENYSTQIDLVSFGKGVYVVSLTNGSKQSVKKIMVY